MFYFTAQLLLAFFITAQVVMLTGAADSRPDATLAPADAPQLTADEITTIALRKEEQELIITIDNETISADDLPASLQKLAQERPDQKIQIRARRDTPWQQVHDVITACSQAGLHQIIFGAPLPDTNP